MKTRILLFLALVTLAASNGYAADCWFSASNVPSGSLVGQVFQHTNGSYYRLTGVADAPGERCATFGVVQFSGSVVWIRQGLINSSACYSSGSYTMGSYYWTVVPQPTCTPPHCSNASKDYDETGIDCGGSCPAQCMEYCPSPSTVHTYTINGGQQVTECAVVVRADPAGNCPSGYTSGTKTIAGDGIPAGAKICGIAYDPYLAAESVPSGNRPTVEVPSGFSGGSVNTISSNPSGTITDNGDGTSTKTETSTETKTGADGQQHTTTTTIKTYYSGPGGTGNVTGTEKTKTSDDPTEEPSNYNYNPALNDSGSISPSEYGNEPNWDSLKQDVTDIINNVKDAITNTVINTSNASCTLDFMTYKGKTIRVNICPYESVLTMMGGVLVALSYVAGIVFYVDRG